MGTMLPTMIPTMVPAMITAFPSEAPAPAEELIDADVAYSSDTGWTYGSRFTGFSGSVDFDESDPDTTPLSANFKEPLEAGDHLVTGDLTGSNGEYLIVSIDGNSVAARSALGPFEVTYTAVGGELQIILYPQGELDLATGTITSISVKRIT